MDVSNYKIPVTIGRNPYGKRGYNYDCIWDDHWRSIKKYLRNLGWKRFYKTLYFENYTIERECTFQIQLRYNINYIDKQKRKCWACEKHIIDMDIFSLNGLESYLSSIQKEGEELEIKILSEVFDEVL